MGLKSHPLQAPLNGKSTMLGMQQSYNTISLIVIFYLSTLNFCKTLHFCSRRTIKLICCFLCVRLSIKSINFQPEQLYDICSKAHVSNELSTYMYGARCWQSSDYQYHPITCAAHALHKSNGISDQSQSRKSRKSKVQLFNSFYVPPHRKRYASATHVKQIK